ncbi:MAG TPA: TRAP transporter substrate-binding protein [Xanthomonadaceae bacterium]|nr:TRAP transporter substrate-binding protein [Xanthomonadaceae bacterium]
MQRPAWLLIAWLLILPAPTALAARWNMPTPYPEGEHHTRNIRLFADDVREATGGDLDIVVHANGTLFRHEAIHRAVRSGQVPIGEMLIGLLGNDDPLFKADNLPFIASDFESARRLWQVTRTPMEEALEKQGLVLLFAVPWPPQGLYTKTPVTSVDELRGTRMRAYSPLTSRLAVLLDATPTTVQVPEIAQAFGTGMIDAMITSAATGVSSQAWDFVGHYTDTRAWIPKNMVILNRRAFQRLPESQRQALLAAAARAEARGWTMAEEDTARRTAELATHGIQVTQPSPQLEAGLRAIGRTLLEEWLQEVGTRGQVVLDALDDATGTLLPSGEGP